MTNEQHNTYTAYTFIAHGLFMLFITAMVGLIFFVISTVPDEPGNPTPPRLFFGIMFAFIAAFYSFFMIPSFIAAYGILKKRPWARLSAIIAGAIAAVNVPVGTAACVYALWFFLGDNWKSVYPDATDSAGVHEEYAQIPYGDESGWQSRASEEFAFRENDMRNPPDWR
ncbi:MAG: hypothetical protein LC734_06345 [Acidobacteria bacterium]|nr:hypothetical protein [Acidobacteriota bacterium]